MLRSADSLYGEARARLRRLFGRVVASSLPTLRTAATLAGSGLALAAGVRTDLRLAIAAARGRPRGRRARRVRRAHPRGRTDLPLPGPLGLLGGWVRDRAASAVRARKEG
jgi:hypothetical protein